MVGLRLIDKTKFLFRKKKEGPSPPDKVVRRIWNSLRKRYNVRPKDFETQSQLISFLEKKNSPSLRLARTKKFWERSKEKIAVKVREHVRLMWRKVLKTRKDGIKQHYWLKVPKLIKSYQYERFKF